MLDTQIRIELKNVLFPTDFSSAANAALPYAAEIARRYRANLYTMARLTFKYIPYDPSGNMVHFG